jgi:hypothetical protein
MTALFSSVPETVVNTSVLVELSDMTLGITNLTHLTPRLTQGLLSFGRHTSKRNLSAKSSLYLALRKAEIEQADGFGGTRRGND